MRSMSPTELMQQLFLHGTSSNLSITLFRVSYHQILHMDPDDATLRSILTPHVTDLLEQGELDLTMQSKRYHLRHCFLDYYLCLMEGAEVDQTELDAVLERINVMRELFRSDWNYPFYVAKEIVRQMPFFVAYKDLNERYQIVSDVVNKAYRDHFDTIEGASIDDIYPEDEAAVVRQLDQEVLERKATCERMVPTYTDQGIRIIESKRIPIFHQTQEEMIGILSIGIDVTDIEHNRRKLAIYGDLQTALVDMAKALVQKDAGAYSDPLTNALSLMGQAVNADRAYIFDYDTDKQTTSNTHEWVSTGTAPEIDNLQYVPMNLVYEGWIERHFQNEHVFIHNVDELDHDSELYRILHSQDIKSLITLPIFVHNVCVGFVGLDAVKEHQAWSEYLELFQIIPELISAYFIDTTYEQSIKDALTKAERANTIKNNFLRNMSHEIRTPLSAVVTSLEMLEDTALTGQQDQLLQIANESMTQLQSIIDSILTFTSIEADSIKLQPAPTALEELLSGLLSTSSQLMKGDDVSLRFHYDYRIPELIMTDPGKLRQIVLNILDNAIKFTSNGSITLRTELLALTRHEATVRLSIADTGVGIDPVHHSTLYQEFFQIESSTSRAHSGLGLGLSIVKELCERMGITIDLQSEIGVGTTFHLTIPFKVTAQSRKTLIKDIERQVLLVTEDPLAFAFPAFFESMEVSYEIRSYSELPNIQPSDYDLAVFHVDNLSRLSTKPALHSLPRIALYDPRLQDEFPRLNDHVDLAVRLPISRRSFLKHWNDLGERPLSDEPVHPGPTSPSTFDARVLVVDDNAINRQILRMKLKQLHVESDVAEDGYIALDRCLSTHYDLILLDIQMPGMDGYETFQELRKLPDYGHVPVYAITASTLEEDRIKSKEVGMNGLLHKPIDPSALERLLGTHLTIPTKEPSTQPMPSHLVVFDDVRFEQLYDPTTRHEILDVFLTDYPTDIAELQSLIREGSMTAFLRKVHYFKGSFSYLACARATWMCTQLLEEGPGMNQREMTKRIDELLETFTQAHQALASYAKAITSNQA